MAEISTASAQLSVEARTDTAKLARERLLWAVKPFGFLGLVLWILSPGTSAEAALGAPTLLAFLLGSTYGVLFFYAELRAYFAFRFDGGRDQKNRLPDEFYVGTVDEVRIEWNT